MTYVRWLNEIGSGDKSWAGEKAEAFGELIRAGLQTPRGFCVSAQAYQDTLAAHRLEAKISGRLAAIDVGDPAQLEQAAEEIRNWIMDAPIAGEIEGQVQSALAALDSKLYAVRVSRVLQDVPDPASSGLPQAHLAILSAGVLDAIRQCWTTPWNSRAIYFRQRKKIADEQVTMAVIVQKMIDSEAGGVLFSSGLAGAGSSEVHIDAIWGLGEAVNAARWKPDHFVVDKASGAIRSKSIATKTVMDVAAAEGGLQTIGVPEEKQASACLTDAQVAALADIGNKIEKHFGAPRDIDWSRIGDSFFILQARGITKS